MAKKQPKISFVMPTKNRGHIIKESIKTIIEQTVPDWELIVVDDHSNKNDGTEKVIEKINDNRIKYIRMKKNRGGGIPETRNFGNMFAKAPIIAVTDSDDLYVPERAEITVNTFEREGCDVFYGNYDILNKTTGEISERIKYPIIDFDLKILKQYNLIPHGSSAYKREIAYRFPYNSFFRRASDYDFFVRLAVAGKKFYFCDKKIFRYVILEDNVSGGKKIPTGYNELIWNNNNWLNESREVTLKRIFDREKILG